MSSGHTMSPSQHIWLPGFCYGWPDTTVWNSLPDNLWDPDVTIDNFKYLLKMFLFQHTSAISLLDVLWRCALQIYGLPTYLLCWVQCLNHGTVYVCVCVLIDACTYLEFRALEKRPRFTKWCHSCVRTMKLVTCHTSNLLKSTECDWPIHIKPMSRS